MLDYESNIRGHGRFHYRMARNFQGIQFSRKAHLQRFRNLIFMDGRSRVAPPTISVRLRLLLHTCRSSNLVRTFYCPVQDTQYSVEVYYDKNIILLHCIVYPVLGSKMNFDLTWTGRKSCEKPASDWLIVLVYILRESCMIWLRLWFVVTTCTREFGVLKLNNNELVWSKLAVRLIQQRHAPRWPCPLLSRVLKSRERAFRHGWFRLFISRI